MPGHWRDRLSRRPLLVDTVIALALTVLGLLYLLILEDVLEADGQEVHLLLGIVLLLPQTLPLIVRRRYPLTVLAVVTVPNTIIGFHVPETIASPVAYFIAFYTAGAYVGGRRSTIVRGLSAAVGIGVVAYIVLARDAGPEDSGLPAVAYQAFSILLTVFYLAAAWFMGDANRLRREHEVELSERADELAAAQATIAQQAVEAERVRIARELHDVLAHHVSVMGVQAGAARRVLARSPDQAAEMLRGIEAASREAVAELHRLLGFLRSQSEDEAAVPPPVTAPQPSLARLDALVAQMTEAGLDVTLRVEGLPGAVPVTVDLSAYRVVQEALTNSLKHAGEGAAVAVTLAYQPDELAVRVVDDGRGRLPVGVGPGAAVGGRGLVGMRERLGLHGGALSVGPRSEGGFEVEARFPLATRT